MKIIKFRLKKSNLSNFVEIVLNSIQKINIYVCIGIIIVSDNQDYIKNYSWYVG